MMTQQAPRKSHTLRRILISIVGVFAALVVVGAIAGPSTPTHHRAATTSHVVTPPPQAVPSAPPVRDPVQGKDQVYVSVIAAVTGTTPTDAQTAEYVALGHDVCQVMATNSVMTETLDVEGLVSGGIPQDIAQAIVGAAIGTYCPQSDR